MRTSENTAPAARDNLLGVCHAIGQAFGFDPLLLRIAFGIGLLIDFRLTLLGYALLAVAVFAASLVARLTQPATGADLSGPA